MFDSEQELAQKTGDFLCSVCGLSRDWLLVHIDGMAARSTEGAATITGLACNKCGFIRLHMHA